MTRVLVTGAASGLGRALALAWANNGARLLLADVSPDRGAESVEMCLSAGAAEAHYLHLDVRSENDFAQTFAWVQAHWGGIDIVVNNAGVAGGGRFEGITEDDWNWMLEVNLMGVVRGCRAFTPLFKQQEHGQFVNIASMAGLLNPPAMSNYNVAKAGVIALSETLAVELSPWNIRTLVVCPSYFQTNLADSLRTQDEAMKAALPKLLATSELSADDIAAGILEAIAGGEAMYLPHPRARAAWRQKQEDPAAFRADLEVQAMKLAGLAPRKP